MKKNSFACSRTNCTANAFGVCNALVKSVEVKGRTHTINAEYIDNCPFFADKTKRDSRRNER
jgi:hypothetical protein